MMLRCAMPSSVLSMHFLKDDIIYLVIEFDGLIELGVPAKTMCIYNLVLTTFN